MNIYLISGLATDSRIFKYIKVPEGFNLFYLDLINPRKQESLHGYSMRLAEKINDAEPFILAGLSFGGMLAIEIAKKIKPAAIILISSISASTQLPGYYRAASNLSLHKLIPISLIKTITEMRRSFLYKKSADKIFMMQLASETDPKLLRWSFDAILKWENKEVPENTWHIHGSSDEILPLRFTRPTHVINKAKHLFIINRPDEFNDILREILTTHASFNIQLSSSA